MVGSAVVRGRGEMNYVFLADIVRVFHLLWISILVISFICFHLRIGPRLFFAACAGTTMVCQVLWLGCPLTALETTLRRLGGKWDCDYDGSLVCYIILKCFDVHIHPAFIFFMLTSVFLVALGIAYKEWRYGM